MSTKRGGTTKGPPKHQNTSTWKPNRGVKKSEKDLGGKVNPYPPIVGVCERCRDQLEWRRKYGKYKLLREPAKCVKCTKRNIRQPYMALCPGCASERNVCAKCCKPASVILGANAKKEKEEMKRLEEALGSLRERERRSLLRAMAKGGDTSAMADKAEKLQAARGSEDEDDDDPFGLSDEQEDKDDDDDDDDDDDEADDEDEGNFGDEAEDGEDNSDPDSRERQDLKPGDKAENKVSEKQVPNMARLRLGEGHERRKSLEFYGGRRATLEEHLGKGLERKQHLFLQDHSDADVSSLGDGNESMEDSMRGSRSNSVKIGKEAILEADEHNEKEADDDEHEHSGSSQSDRKH